MDFAIPRTGQERGIVSFQASRTWAFQAKPRRYAGFFRAWPCKSAHPTCHGPSNAKLVGIVHPLPVATRKSSPDPNSGPIADDFEVIHT